MMLVRRLSSLLTPMDPGGEFLPVRMHGHDPALPGDISKGTIQASGVYLTNIG